MVTQVILEAASADTLDTAESVVFLGTVATLVSAVGLVIQDIAASLVGAATTPARLDIPDTPDKTE